MENVPFLNVTVVRSNPSNAVACFDFVLHALQQSSASGNKYLMIQYPPQFRGLFYPCTPSLPLILSSASLTGFQQTPPPPPPPPHPRLRSPSLCGTPRALSGLRYDIITASTTIIQQCGRIVAASGATPPSARRCRLSGPPLLSSRHGLTASLPPFFLPLLPLIKERLLAFLVVLPLPPPSALIRN